METTSLKEGNKSKNYFVFFDLDHTIVSAVSGRELALGAYRRGLMKRSDIINAISLSVAYKMKLVDPAKAIDKMGRWVKGITAGTLESLGTEVSEKVLIPAVYQQARDEIKLHRDNNAKLILLSSTLAPVCRKMSEYLGMDDILCSGLEEVDGILTGRPEGAFCFGEEKAIRLKHYCEKNNNNPEDAWYYGDSISDLPVLKMVGFPVCVNPDRKLAKAANENSWKICYWK
jgi:HAD superfamily hydrolase (TIGR01490 family)